ncbi:iron-sulfur cluster assembly scaffold protein [Candidatus Phytoplasma solani]|uniref:iron-sulfur cluster assembly scaffold protein n=1 Tax=Candidatus Phytoplasma solani TaxID=69896 RepID=UPI00358F71A0
MLNQAKHKLIINHYRNPQNQTNVKLQDYHQFEKKTSYCGDQVILQVKLTEHHKILDLKYKANACSMSLASASLMSVHMKNLDKTTSLNKIKCFLAMINKEDYNPDELHADLKALDIVDQLPHKLNCVALPWQTLQAFLLS